MSMSDSTRDLYKVLQEKAKTSRDTWTEFIGSTKAYGSRPPAGARRRAGRPPAKKRWRIPPKVRLYFPYVVAFLVILSPLLYNPPRNNQVPPYLIGAWETNAPGYEDRYLLFANRNVAFGTGRYEGESYIVAEVQASPVDNGAEYGASKSEKMLITIRYMKPDKLEYGLTFYYDPPPGEVISFKYQEKLKWTKKKGPDS